MCKKMQALSIFPLTRWGLLCYTHTNPKNKFSPRKLSRMFEFDKYQTFSFENGVILVSGNVELNSEMSNNPQWFTFRKVGDLAVFVSSDIAGRLDKEGLPTKVIKFIALHQHEVL